MVTVDTLSHIGVRSHQLVSDQHAASGASAPGVVVSEWIDYAASMDEERGLVNEVDYLELEGCELQGLHFVGEIGWHNDAWHPKWTALVVLRNDAGYDLCLGNLGRVRRKPMPVGAVVVFDCHKEHAVLRRGRTCPDTLETTGYFVAAVHETDKRPRAAEVVAKLTSPHKVFADRASASRVATTTPQRGEPSAGVPRRSVSTPVCPAARHRPGGQRAAEASGHGVTTPGPLDQGSTGVQP